MSSCGIRSVFVDTHGGLIGELLVLVLVLVLVLLYSDVHWIWTRGRR